MSKESVSHFPDTELNEECNQENRERKERIEHQFQLILEIFIFINSFRHGLKVDLRAVSNCNVKVIRFCHYSCIYYKLLRWNKTYNY